MSDLRADAAGRAIIMGAAACIMLAVTIMAVRLVGFALFFASWASSLAVILSASDGRTTRPQAIGFSHVIAAAAGIFCRAFFPGEAWAIGAAVGCALAATAAVGLLHPPAIGNAAFAFATPQPWPAFMAAASIGALCLCASAVFVRWLAATREPV
jgi:hypothetical protein